MWRSLNLHLDCSCLLPLSYSRFMNSDAFIHQIFSTLYYHVKVFTISDLVIWPSLLTPHNCTFCTVTLASKLRIYGCFFMVYFCVFKFLSTTLLQPDMQLEPFLHPPLLTFIFLISFLPFMNCFFHVCLALILVLPFFPSSIPLHTPTACRTLTAGCVYHPLSDRGITSHGRLADWPCPALPGIHTAARLIQLAWLATETSAILITKMMYFNPTNSIHWRKAAVIYVCVCLCVCVCRNLCNFSGNYLKNLNTNMGEISVKGCGIESCRAEPARRMSLKLNLVLHWILWSKYIQMDTNTDTGTLTHVSMTGSDVQI